MLIELGSHVHWDGVARDDDGLTIDDKKAFNIPRIGGIVHAQGRCHMFGHMGFIHGDHPHGDFVPTLAQLSGDAVLFGQAQCRGNRAHVGAAAAPTAAINKAFIFQNV